MKYYDSFALLFKANQQSIGDLAQREPFYLFKWCLGRLLLGDALGNSSDWLHAQLLNFHPSGNAIEDAVKWTYLIACLELHGQSGIEEAEKALAYLTASPSSALTDYRIVESALALSTLSNKEADRHRWLNAAGALPILSETQIFTYELLFLSSLIGRTHSDDVGLSANLVARVGHDFIWAPPYYSAASHCCVLAQLARRQNQALPELLSERLKIIDHLVFGNSDTPILSFKKPTVRLSRKPDSQAALEITIIISGEGELDTSVYLLEPLTSNFLNTLQKKLNKKESPGEKKVAQDLLSKEALFNASGICRIRLRLEPTVTISPQHQAWLMNRVELAMRIARQQLANLVCTLEVELIQ
jgi:hypothetical protein